MSPRRLTLVLGLLAAPAPRALDAQDASVPSADPSPRPYRVIVDHAIIEELARVADTATTENARCLIGVMQGDSAIVDLLWTPHVEFSSRTVVRYRACPLATIAEWHNHVPTADRSPEDFCYLSRTDILDGLRREAAPIQIVQVTADVACWWARAEVATARDETILRSRVGQSTSLLRPLPTSGAAVSAVARVAHEAPPRD